MVQPHFTMLWNERIPRLEHADAAGLRTTVTVVAGALDGAGAPLPPPPESWAAQADADVAIWTLRMEPGAHWTLPAARGQGTRRMLYWFVGEGLSIAGEPQGGHAALEAPAIRLGASVSHPKFGEGVVTNYEGSGAHARVQVEFAEAGSKWLVMAYANLNVL